MEYRTRGQWRARESLNKTGPPIVVEKMISKQATIKCSFCKQVGVMASHIPSFLKGTTRRISAGARTKYHRDPEHYEALSGCPSSGKNMCIGEMSAAGRRCHLIEVLLY
jgi:hypothetical protein